MTLEVPIVITFVVLILAIAAFVSGRIPVGLVALGVTLALFFTGVVTFEQAIAGFGDPVVVYIAALFVVSEALDATGVTTWAGQQVTKRAGKKLTMVLVWMMLLVAVVTALISVNGAVAALIPVGVVLAMRIGRPPSQLLMPLAFASHAGSMLTLTGTPVNVLVNELAMDAGARPFGFFEFAIVGLPLLAGTIVIVILLAPRVLPSREAEHAARDLSQHAETLALQYSLTADDARIDRTDGLTEVVIPPRSPFIGDTVFPGMRTESDELVIVAIQRGGDDVAKTTLRAGDLLLLRGTWDALDTHAADPGVVVIDAPPTIRRQAVALGQRSIVAIVVLVAMVVLLATGLVPAAIAALAAAGAMVLLRALSVRQAHRSISITTLLLVAGMIPLSTAIQTSGAADLISDGILVLLGDAGPIPLLLGIVLVVAILGQFISNMATVLIVAPIAMTVAETTGYSPLPLLMGIAVAGAASFLTPVATPANTMIMGPGAYKFGDYWKLGLPILVLFVAVAVLLVPAVWPF